MLSQYGNETSYALAYNLFADQLLGTNLVPSFVYNVTQQYIMTPSSEFSKVSWVNVNDEVCVDAGPYGVVLDSRQSNNSKSGTSYLGYSSESSIE
jgi:Domain of unknown function (DUF1793)